MEFILLAANASIMAATRQPIGKLRDDPDISLIFVAARGNRLELPWPGGKVAELGPAWRPDVDAQHCHAILKPYIIGTPA